MNSTTIVSKIWSFCTTLRDDGVSYGSYLEQLTYLLFLKMADEYSKPPYSRKLDIADEYGWHNLVIKKGTELENHYNLTLHKLASSKGILGQIFVKAQNKIQDPAKLSRLIDMIDKEEWSLMNSDVKGDIYEGILEKNAEDTKSGAGQYFTPRALIKAIVKCIAPLPNKTICDPACGTGGFFLSSYDYIVNHYKLDQEQKRFLKTGTFFGNEIVPETRRLALMNLFLHNIGEMDSPNYISSNDSLIADDGNRYDYVITNPPFGKKSSMTFTNEEGEQEKESLTYNRQDFWVTTSNKQLNFLQHIKTILKANAKAAVVLPDNVLFEGGAGETIRKKLLEVTNLHTILRLPTGIFYAQGVKANVLFFDMKPASSSMWTRELWIYDFRTNINFTLKKNPLKLEDLSDFTQCFNITNIADRVETYHPENNPEGRWRKFNIDEVLARDKTNLDITWLKDDNAIDIDNLPEPSELVTEITANLELVLQKFKNIAQSLNN